VEEDAGGACARRLTKRPGRPGIPQTRAPFLKQPHQRVLAGRVGRREREGGAGNRDDVSEDLLRGHLNPHRPESRSR